MLQNIMIIVGMMIFALSLGETGYRLGLPSYISRKMVHISSALITLLLPQLISLPTAVTLGLSMSAILFLALKLKLLPSLYLGNHESVGPSLFGIGLTISAITFWSLPPYIFQMSCLILGFSDALAGIIGRTYGRIKYQLSTEKTLEGSLVFFTVTIGLYLGMLLFYRTGIDTWHFGKILLASLILTFSEAVFGNGWDNIILPFISGLISVWVFN